MIFFAWSAYLVTGRVPERRDGLLVVVRGRADGADHQSLGVAAQRVLQDSSERGVSVRNHFAFRFSARFLCQGRDHDAENRQRLVDRAAFLEPVSGCAGLGGFLAAGQVDEVDDGDLVGGPSVLQDLLHEVDGDDSVGSRAMRVHFCGADRPVSAPLVHLGRDLFVGPDSVVREALHVHAQRLALAHFEAALHPVARVDQQVLYFLVVDLDHADRDLERDVRVRAARDAVEYFF